MDLEQMHRKFAVDCFNGTWDLIEKDERTAEESQKMVAMAYASLYHWSEVGEPINQIRGHWQISRVWSIASEPDNALDHAMLSLALCEHHNITGLDLAFAYEAVARAHALTGNIDERDEYITKAREAAEGIEKAEDKDYLLREVSLMPEEGLCDPPGLRVY